MSPRAFYFLAAGAGVVIAHFISRAPELRSMRLSQLVFVPVAMVLCVYFASLGGMVGFVLFLGVMIFLVVLLAPNIGYHCGAALTNFLDPMDWTPTDEEIALRPIRLLIDKDQFIEAFAELEKLLKNYKPTYEAVLLSAKLHHQLGRADETVAALLSLIGLSQTPAQQLTVMELLASVKGQHQMPPKAPAFGTRRIRIDHELVLFQPDGDDVRLHKVIPAGVYEVEEILCHNRRWLKLKGENWGNAEMCWEAVVASQRPADEVPKNGFFRTIARMHQVVSVAIKGKPHRQRRVDAQNLFNEANQFIRQDDWRNALALLQQASACDPDRYEIAYRWVLAVRHTANDAVTAEVVGKALRQSRWSEDERQMLQQLKRPLAK